MKNFARIVSKIIVLQLFLCACTTPVSVTDQSGFLSDNSKLDRIDDSMLQFVDESAGDYSSFIIEPIVIVFRQAPDEQVFTDEELSELSAYYEKAVIEALSRNEVAA